MTRARGRRTDGCGLRRQGRGHLFVEDLSALHPHARRGIILRELANLLAYGRHLEVLRADHRVDQDALLLLLAQAAKRGVLWIGFAVVILHARELIAIEQLEDRVRDIALVELRERESSAPDELGVFGVRVAH